METNEIMTNEEVKGVTDVVMSSNSGGKVALVAGLGLVVGVSALTYKYAVKPLVVKVKTKKNFKHDTSDTSDQNVVDCDYTVVNED